MRRTRAADNSTTLATPIDTATGGYYKAGPPATIFSVDDANIIQEELVALATVKGASLDTAGTTTNQCAKAVESPSNLVTGSADVPLANISTVWRNGMLAASSSKAGADAGSLCAIIASSFSSVINTGSAIVGGFQHTGTGKYVAIIGGQANNVSGDNNVIAGGDGNGIDTNPWNFIGGGQRNTSSYGSRGAILGGDANIIYGANRTVIAGAAGNVAAVIGTGTTSDCFIGGGYYNYLSETIGCVVLGTTNGYISASRESSIIGGTSNHIKGDKSSIIGGKFNSISATYGIILGTNGGKIVGGGSVENSSLVGGKYLTCSNEYSSLIGGQSNEITGAAWQSTIIGGNYNRIAGVTSAVVAGVNCSSSAGYTFMGGASIASASSADSYVGMVSSYNCWVSGACQTVAMLAANTCAMTFSVGSVMIGTLQSYMSGVGYCATVGGQYNSFTGATGSIILGGQYNKILYSNCLVAASQYGTASSVGGVGGSSVISSYSSSCGASFGTVIASELCNAGPNYYTAFIGDSYCSSSNINQTNVTVLSSKYVTLGLGGATGSYQVVGGFNSSHTGVAPSWRIASNGGIIHATITTLQGVDYAELFVNFDKKKHPVGRILTRKGTAAKLANFPNERILGVVSACPNIIGGADNLTWQGEWLKDEWGAFIMEQVDMLDIRPDGTTTVTPITTRKRNPLYDSGKIHIPRTERPDEWTVVGLLGQIRVAIDETVEEDDYIVSGPEGIGTKSDYPGKGRAIECMQIEVPFSKEVGYGVALCLVG